MIHVAVLSYDHQPAHAELQNFGLYVEEFAGKTVEIEACSVALQEFNTGLKATVFRLTTTDKLASDTMAVVVMEPQSTVKTMLADITAYIESIAEQAQGTPGPLFSNDDVSWCYLRETNRQYFDNIFALADVEKTTLQ